MVLKSTFPHFRILGCPVGLIRAGHIGTEHVELVVLIPLRREAPKAPNRRVAERAESDFAPSEVSLGSILTGRGGVQ